MTQTGIIIIAKILGITSGIIAIFIIANNLWTIIHEFAHLIAAKLIFGVSEWEMKVRPCKLNGRKVSGYVRYYPIKPLTNKGTAIVSLAPFMISILTCILLPICIKTGNYILATIILAGVIDMIGEATAEADTFWDLPSASKDLNIPLWRMRVYCLSIAIVSMAVSGFIFGVNMIEGMLGTIFSI